MYLTGFDYTVCSLEMHNYNLLHCENIHYYSYILYTCRNEHYSKGGCDGRSVVEIVLSYQVLYFIR